MNASSFSSLVYLAYVKRKKTLYQIFCALTALILSNSASAADTNNPCLPGYTYHIVVLGSSTAAGAGPSHPDSTWVNRYRSFLQRINSQNMVTNLAQGGTTTYHIMPDWFTAPVGRPARNTTRNVSEAIRLQADAIIVNMPSNDAANGFTLNEQMFNFDMIARSADSAGIPVWVCTTQPRNFSASKVQLQMDVRDSILSHFGSKAIDFWSGFANSSGGLDSAFDSGDGVHMNDPAHRVLFQRVQAKNILSALTDTLTKPDHFVQGIASSNYQCGQKKDSVWVNISNSGVLAAYSLPLRWRVENMGSGTVSTSYDTLYGGVPTCSQNSRHLLLNTGAGGIWKVSAHLETISDSISANDHSDTLILHRTAAPKPMSMDLSVCEGELADLFATGGDTTLWLDRNGSIIGFGDTLHYGPVYGSDTLTARAVKGDLNNARRLFTHDNSNIDWNGVMFDLIAQDTLHIDSLALRPSQLSTAQVTGRYRNGSHKGFESNPAAWTMWGVDSVHPVNPGDLVVANFGPRVLYPGDTMGVYLSMQSGSSLKYRSLSSEASYINGPLELQSGTGISAGFTGTYYPRAWSGEVYFHYGFNPYGVCSKDTIVIVDLFPNYLDLGNDTTLALHETLALSLPSGLFNPQWSTGDSSAVLYVDSSMADTNGEALIWVSCVDFFGCQRSDTILINFESGIGLRDLDQFYLPVVYPNPAIDKLIVVNPTLSKMHLRVYNSKGQMLKNIFAQPGENELVLDFKPGLYIILWEGSDTWSCKLQVLN